MNEPESPLQKGIQGGSGESATIYLCIVNFTGQKSFFSLLVLIAIFTVRFGHTWVDGVEQSNWESDILN